MLLLLQVNTNGVLSFRFPFLDFLPRPFPLDSGEVLIAPFWDDFDLRQGGQILFRQTSDENLLSTVGVMINETLMCNFSPTTLFIATWNGVPGFQIPITVCLCSQGSV